MRSTIIALILCFLSMATPAHSKALSTTKFEQIPVLYEGRIKPLDSLARLYIDRFSDHQTIDGLSASAWLAEVIFDPATAAQRDIFLLRSKELKHLLGLPPEKTYASFTDLQPGLEKTRAQISALLSAPAKDLTAQQNALLQLHENAASFAQLMRSFSLILPLDIDLPQQYAAEFEGKPITYLALGTIEAPVLGALKNLVRRKGENIESYSEEEAKLAQLSFNLQTFRSAGERNTTLRVMPATWNDGSGEWYAPWALLLEGHGSPQSKAYLDLWQDMARAYREDNAENWNTANDQIIAAIKGKVGAGKLKLEILYNAFKPFHWALALYSLTILILIGTMRSDDAIIKNAALFSVSCGAIIHASGIAARMFLLDRPPVGTLYESLLFVSLICAFFALAMFLRTKNFAALFAGAVSASGMLIIAPYIIPDGQNMEMLVAVLNTNFWLGTHVLCITIGYAVSVFAACLAHGYLLLRIKGASASALKKLQTTIYKISIAALLFTAVGTALGGIWADQSWGRFWGWDPKENGALLIVLWLIWLQHGRISAHLKPLAFIAGTAYLNVIVALAWFGVNLLSVGLHSYGFIDGILYGLTAFCAIETVLIGGAWLLIRHNEHKTKGARHAS